MNKKELQERLNEIKDSMTAIVDSAKAENRNLSDEEIKNFNDLKAEATQTQATIDAQDAVDKMQTVKTVAHSTLSKEDQDVKNFADFVRNAITGEPFQTGDSPITKGDNGAIIPTTIANMVIKSVTEISPVFAKSHRYNVKGNLQIPAIAAADNGIAMDYASEFEDLESVSATFSSVDLTGYLAGVLVKISNSLINNTDIALVNEVVRLMSDAVAKFYEHEVLIGNSGTGKAAGLYGATNVVTTAAATAIKADELIELQDSIKSAYQRDAFWVMNPATLTAIRKLKTADGIYLLNPDIRGEFGYTLLGKPVYTSDAMPVAAAGAKTIVYGDFMNAVAVKLVEDFQIQVLREKFATQHATGLVGWTEFDAKVMNNEAVAILKQHA